jgi:hypothetical protein
MLKKEENTKLRRSGIDNKAGSYIYSYIRVLHNLFRLKPLFLSTVDYEYEPSH